MSSLLEIPKLRDWSSLTEEIPVPPDIAAAMFSGRKELIRRAAKPLGVEEVNNLLNIIRVLLDTNRELRRHSQLVAVAVDQIRGQTSGLFKLILKAGDLADFRETGEAGDKDEEEN